MMSTMSRWIHASKPVMAENTTLTCLILKPGEEWMKSQNTLYVKTLYAHAVLNIQDGVATNGQLYLPRVVMVCMSLDKKHTDIAKHKKSQDSLWCCNALQQYCI